MFFDKFIAIKDMYVAKFYDGTIISAKRIASMILMIASPFITTMVDVFGLLIYFTLAKIILKI